MTTNAAAERFEGDIGAALREDVAKAQRELDTFDDALAKVRPFMEGTGLTLAEAIQVGAVIGWPAPGGAVV